MLARRDRQVTCGGHIATTNPQHPTPCPTWSAQRQHAPGTPGRTLRTCRQPARPCRLCPAGCYWSGRVAIHDGPWGSLSLPCCQQTTRSCGLKPSGNPPKPAVCWPCSTAASSLAQTLVSCVNHAYQHFALPCLHLTTRGFSPWHIRAGADLSPQMMWP